MLRSQGWIVVRATARFGATVLLACLPLLTPAVVCGQPQAATASVSGTVRDPGGKAVVAAPVLVRNEQGGVAVSTTTDGQGRFSAIVPSGIYTVEVTAPGFELVSERGVQTGSTAASNLAIKLTLGHISESVTVSVALPAAAAAAPSQGSLMARSAQSLISSEYVKNYTSPFSDYSQVLVMAPGTFSVSANGPGLGDTKTFFRGFKDGYYNMTYDGIPFNDTNDPTHHSWVFFPAQTIGSTVFDRSPGPASTIGPATFGGSVSLLSPAVSPDQRINATASYGSFNTKLYDFGFDAGKFANGKMRLMFEGHEMTSDGYQTFNHQKRKAFSAKYVYNVSDNTQVTAVSSVVDLRANTPDQKGSTRAQLAQFGNNFLMTDDPSSPLYYQFNFYRIPTNFEYVGVKTSLGHGWSIDNRTYTMRYHNQQNFNSTTKINTTSGTDKLNAYWKVGDNIPFTQVSSLGVFRAGLWWEYASSDRHQTPADPRTWILSAVPNFHESYFTTTVQPYTEYELQVTSHFRVTPGIKLASYKQDFTQYADNGGKIGNLGGAPSIRHAVVYRSWLPSIDAHYLVQSAWSLYGQYSRGQVIPPTSIFDVTGAQVATLPAPTLTDTVQVGSVWKSNRATLDVDYYHIKLQNDYSSATDPDTGFTNYYLDGDAVTKGVEAESTLLLGGGLAVYLNGTAGTAKYTDTGLWAQNAPKDTETIGVTYNHGPLNVGLFNKRVGRMYNDNGAVNQAFVIDPFNLTNLFFNYTVGGRSHLTGSRLRLAINNLTDSHALTGVPKGGSKTSTSATPNDADLLTVLAGRSVSVSFTVGLSPRTP